MDTPSRAGKKRALSQVRKTPGGGSGSGGGGGPGGGSGGSAGGRAIAYGDHVRLAVKATGLLGAEGVLDSECRLIQGSTTRQDRSVWRICTAFQYSATKELNEYIKETSYALEDNTGEETPGRTSESVDSQLHALQRGKRYEDMQNAATNQQRRGEPVKFGDTIQLLHVNSGKFLTVRSNKTAELERENLQICLDSSGSMMSHLKVEARLKIDEEAVTLQNNTEIFFKVAEREREFVHCSQDRFKIHSIAFGGAARVGQKCYVEEGETFEINCSLTKTVWQVQVFDAVDDFGSEYLRAGDVVYFHDPDAKLTLHLVDPFTMASKELQSYRGSTSDELNPVVTPAKAAGAMGSSKKFDTFFRSHRDDEEPTDSNAYWILEKEDASSGGLIWMGGGEEEPSPRVKFRHVNTGRYLYLKNSHMHKAMSKMMASKVLSGLGALGKKLRRDNVTPVAPNSSFKPSSTKRHNRSSVRVISSVQDGSAFATRYSLVYHRSGVSANAAVEQVIFHDPDAGVTNGDADDESHKPGAAAPSALVPSVHSLPTEPTLLTSSSAFHVEVDSHFLRLATSKEQRRIARSDAGIDNGDDDDEYGDDDTDSNDEELVATTKKGRKALRLRAEREGGEAVSLYKLTAESHRRKQKQGGQDDDADDENVDRVPKVPCVASMVQGDALPLVIKRISSMDIAEAAVGCAAYPYFEAFVRALAEMRPKKVLQQAPLFVEVVRRLVNFVTGRDISLPDENTQYEMSKPLPSRQRLLKEQGILGTSIDILKSLLDTASGDGGANAPQSPEHSRSVSPPASMDHHPIGEAHRRGHRRFLAAVSKVKKTVGRSLFQLLFYSIRENPDIQRFTAKNLPMFVTHCERESVATRCIVEMLSKNRDLQETEVSEREVKVFVGMLRASPMHPIFLALLRATCVCSGKGVDKNQQLVANELIMKEENRKLLVALAVNDSAQAKKGGSDAPCDGLSATWVSDCPEFSSRVLFDGKDSVALPELFSVYNDSRVASLGRRFSIGTQYNLVRVSKMQDKQSQVEGGTGTAADDNNDDDGESGDGDKFDSAEPAPNPKRGTKSLFLRALSSNTSSTAVGLKDKEANKRITKVLNRQKMQQVSLFGGGGGISGGRGAHDKVLEASLNIGEPLGMVFTATAVVEEVKEQTQAVKAGIQPGCRIIQVGDQDVQTRNDIKEAVRGVAQRGENYFTIKYRLPPRTNVADIVMARKTITTKLDPSKRLEELKRQASAAEARERSVKESEEAIKSKQRLASGGTKLTEKLHVEAEAEMAVQQRPMSVKDVRRKMVADYIINQIYLLGSMCLDRNYVSMKRIKEAYPYETLVAIITDTRMPSALRSATVYLATSLYVDSKPQSEKPIPNLIRCWNKVDEFADQVVVVEDDPDDFDNLHELDDFPVAKSAAVAEPRRLFQELKSEIAKQLVSLKRGDDFTKQLMHLLQKLMKFQIYVTAQQMQMVVVPILKTLDDRSRLGVSTVAAREETKGGSGKATERVYPTVQEGEVARDDKAKCLPLHIFGVQVNPKAVLDFMESIKVMVFILIIVLVSVVLAVWAELTFDRSRPPPSWLSPFDLTVSAFFLGELSLRWACFVASEGGGSVCGFWDFYRGVDGVCVLLDVAAFVAGSALKSVKTGAKLLKLLRLVRLVRIVRAANIMLEIMKSLQVDDVEEFKLPARYDQMSRDDLQMMANAVDVLVHVQGVADDFRLSKLLQAFKVYDGARILRTRSGGMLLRGGKSIEGLEVTSSTTPSDVFEHIVSRAAKGPQSLSLGKQQDIAHILLNLCLYSGFSDLVQKALSLLMACHNTRKTLLQNLKQMQLLTTTLQERNLRMMQQKLGKLKAHGESYELWLQRATPEEIHIAQEVRSYLVDIVSFVNSRGSGIVLPLDKPPPRGNKMAQSLLRHLDGIDVMVLLFREVSPSLEVFAKAVTTAQLEGNEEEAQRNAKLHADTVDILTLCNQLLSGYVNENFDNQLQAHQSIDLFVKSIDVGVQSASVIAEIFRGNDLLVGRFEQKVVVEMCEQIVRTEKNPEYMRVLHAITQVGTNPSPQLTSHILRELSHPLRESSVIFLCTEGEQFEIRKQLCRQAQSSLVPQRMRNEVSMRHLPPLLAYHITLVDVLAACANGTKNINIVEAKLQSIYPLNSLITGLLQPGLTIEAWLALLRYAKNAFVDAEMRTEELASSILVWRFIFSLPEKLSESLTDVEMFRECYVPPTDGTKSTAGNMTQDDIDAFRQRNHKKIMQAWTYAHRLRLEAAFEALAFLELYFDKHFIPTAVPASLEPREHTGTLDGDESDDEVDGNSGGAGARSGNGASVLEEDDEAVFMLGFDEDMFGEEGEEDWKSSLFKDILSGIRNLVEVGGTFYSDRFVTQCIDTAEIVRAKTGLSSESIWNHIYWNIPVDNDVLEAFRKNRHNTHARYSWSAGSSTSSKRVSLTGDDIEEEEADDDDYGNYANDKGSASSLTTLKATKNRKFSVSNMLTVDGDRVMKSLGAFITSIEQDQGLMRRIELDLYTVVDEIEALPDVFQPIEKGDLRREYLLQRLVDHVHVSTQSGSGLSKHLDADCTRTTGWMLKCFREMIQAKWGMTIDERDEEGGEEEDRKAMYTHALLNNNGVTALCLDLIARGIQDDVKIEAIKLLIALLFREGGNELVQTTIRRHLDVHDSSAFFFEVKNMFERMIKWHEEFPQGNPALQRGGSDDGGKQDGPEVNLSKSKEGIEEDDEPILPGETIVIKMLQLMSEGHFKKNQDIMRVQDAGRSKAMSLVKQAGDEDEDEADGGGDESDGGKANGASLLSSPHARMTSQSAAGVPNEVQQNLLDQMVNHLNTVSKLPFRVATKAATQMADLVLEVLQGPCPANQVYFSRKTDLLEVLNRIMRNRTRKDQVEVEEKRLKFVVIKIFQALLEGRSAKDDLYKKIVGIVHLDVLVRHINIPLPKGFEGMVIDASGKPVAAPDAIEVVTSPQSPSTSSVSLGSTFFKGMGLNSSSGGEGGDWSHGDAAGERLSKAQIEKLRLQEEDEAQKLAETQNELQTQILVLLGMFFEFDKSLKQDKMMMRLEDLMETEVQSVEIVWNGVLQRRFFHVPRQLTALIGEATKHHLLYSIDLNNQDNKLDEFVNGVLDIYLELKWQEYLSEKGVQKIFSRDMQNRATWLSFFLALVVNTIFLFDYRYRDFSECDYGDIGESPLSKVYLSKSRSWNKAHDDDVYEGDNNEYYMQVPCLSPGISVVAKALNYFQIIVALFTFVLFLVVRCKPNFDKALSEDHGELYLPLVGAVSYGKWMSYTKCLFISLCHGFPPGLYYLFYAIVCFLIISTYPPLCSFLLLDIVVKSPTTANVLMAVWKPRKNLGWTILLLLFCVYVFAVSYFFSFRTQEAGFLTEDLNSLWLCFLSVLNWGMRLSGGAGDMMTHDAESGRVAVDFLYFWVIIVVLLNVIFGIIIDTFAELRGKSMDREYKTKKFCFICGISSETFDKAAQLRMPDDFGDDSKYIRRTSGWWNHYHRDHNMWNYAYFVINLKEQDKDDDDGMELYVRHCIDRSDVDWFPKNRAMCLIDEAKGEGEQIEDMLAIVEQKVESSETSLTEAYEKRTEKLQRTIEHLGRSQRDVKAKLESVTEMLVNQADIIDRLLTSQEQSNAGRSGGRGGGGSGGGSNGGSPLLTAFNALSHSTPAARSSPASIDGPLLGGEQLESKDADHRSKSLLGGEHNSRGTTGAAAGVLESLPEARPTTPAKEEATRGETKWTSTTAVRKFSETRRVVPEKESPATTRPKTTDRDPKGARKGRVVNTAEKERKVRKERKSGRKTAERSNDHSQNDDLRGLSSEDEQQAFSKVIDVEAWKSNQNKKVITSERQSIADDLRDRFGFDAQPGQNYERRDEWQGPISSKGPTSVKNFYVVRDRDG